MIQFQRKLINPLYVAAVRSHPFCWKNERGWRKRMKREIIHVSVKIT